MGPFFRCCFLFDYIHFNFFLCCNENKATKETQGHEEGGKGQKGPKYLLVVRDKHHLVGMLGVKKDPSFLEQDHTADPPEALS